MSTFAKDLGPLTSPDRLFSMRIDRDDESVLAALRFHHFPLRPQDLSTFTILPLEKIFSALQLLSAAGFVTLNRSANGRIQTARAVSFTL